MAVIAEVLHYLVTHAPGLSDINRQEFHDALDEAGFEEPKPDPPAEPAEAPAGQGTFEPGDRDAEITALEARLAELRAGTPG